MRVSRNPNSAGSLLKTGERRAVAGVAVLFTLLYGTGWWAVGPVATVPALGILLALLAALVLAGTRRLRGALDEHLQQTQSLLYLQRHLDTDLPLPAFDRGALFPDAAATLVGLIQTRRPRLILELGSGASTLIAAHCLRRQGQGRLISLEHDPDFGAITRDNLARHRLQDLARVVDAPLESVAVGGGTSRWYDRRSLASVDAPVDLLLVDGPPRRIQPLARYPALPLLIDRLAADAVILVDDANRADEREMVARWCREFPGFRVTHIATGEGTVLMQRSGDRSPNV